MDIKPGHDCVDLSSFESLYLSLPRGVVNTMLCVYVLVLLSESMRGSINAMVCVCVAGHGSLYFSPPRGVVDTMLPLCMCLFCEEMLL